MGRIYTFGRFVVDPAARRSLRVRTGVSARPKVFDLPIGQVTDHGYPICKPGTRRDCRSATVILVVVGLRAVLHGDARNAPLATHAPRPRLTRRCRTSPWPARLVDSIVRERVGTVRPKSCLNIRSACRDDLLRRTRTTEARRSPPERALRPDASPASPPRHTGRSADGGAPG